MNASEKQTTAGDRKQKIRDRYKGIDPSLLEVIPAKPSPEALDLNLRHLKVAAYIRVSTENDEQTSSFELQQNDFLERINANSKWDLAGIYADEGISGTNLEHRKGMQQMLEDARAGKIDLILAKSIARFARNVVDCLSVIEELKNLKRPVGVMFDENNLYTLDSTGSLVLTILATVAEEESRSKSFIMNWSIERRFSKGIFLIPELLGYDKDENGDLVVNPTEAETVKVIYYLYLNGWSLTDIAALLTEYGRKTKLGNTVWSIRSLAGVIQNERHCGDIRARKTYTPNFKTHKSVKNNQYRKQYIQRDHHEPIVSREVYNAANHMQASMTYSKKKRPLPTLSVVDEGILRGFVPVDKDWSGFSSEEYEAASRSAMGTEPEPVKPVGKFLNMVGYEAVRPQLFSTRLNPALTISRGKMWFNTACLRKFEDVEYVELLLNTVTGCIAIRPCEKENPNAVHWGRLKGERWVVSEVGCRGLAKTLFDMRNWDEDVKYRFRGQFICRSNEKMMLFELDEPEMTKTIEVEIPAVEGDNTTVGAEKRMEANEEAERLILKQTIRFFPEKWHDSFGPPVIGWGILEQWHYAGDWDVLRPAKELEDYNPVTAAGLEGLMHEAETIMEGWSSRNAG